MRTTDQVLDGRCCVQRDVEEAIRLGVRDVEEAIRLGVRDVEEAIRLGVTGPLGSEVAPGFVKGELAFETVPATVPSFRRRSGLREGAIAAARVVPALDVVEDEAGVGRRGKPLAAEQLALESGEEGCLSTEACFSQGEAADGH